jgi:putative hydrolase of the HAD superfamily
VSEIRTLFWDVGGVLLTNAWDHEERERAFERFRLKKDEFEARHNQVVAALEEGKISLDDYLARTVFDKPRDFTREDFRSFMFSLSKPKPDVLEFAHRLKSKYLMATVNNESRELNEYRIRQFGLLDTFDLFVSSCYVGVRKPDARIYRLALDLIHKPPAECCFIDDRPVNIEAAAKLGIHTILMRDLGQLRKDLQKLAVSA